MRPVRLLSVMVAACGMACSKEAPRVEHDAIFGVALTVPAHFVRTDAADAEQRRQYALDAIGLGIVEPIEVLSVRNGGSGTHARVSVFAFDMPLAETLAGFRQAYVQAPELAIVAEELLELPLAGRSFQGARYEVSAGTGANVYQTVLATSYRPGTIVLSVTTGDPDERLNLEKILHTVSLDP
ncbi:MAG: hypothetical protein ACJATT_003578 [Myxococcota bacterium]|jgi:hypothetical protein